MRFQQNSKFYCEVNERNKAINQFYDPLIQPKYYRKMTAEIRSNIYSVPLFQDNDVLRCLIQNVNEDDNQIQAPENVTSEEKQGDELLKKVFDNTRNPVRHSSRFQPERNLIQSEPFCFNRQIIVKYPQTPHFKSQLQSPFWKFNADHKNLMEHLKDKITKSDFSSVEIDADPLKYVTECIRYFIGLGLKMKQKDFIPESRIFHKLACYIEPFNQKTWRKYLEIEEQNGYIYKSFIISKTAFLFTQNQDFAKSYLSNGQKCGVSLKQMRGILSSLVNPDSYQKGILIELAKLHLKYNKIWKGLKILYQICQWNQFKLPVCSLILFLAKYLQNVGQRDKALHILRKSFNKGMSKLEIYSLYIQMKMREDSGGLQDGVIREVLDYVDCISGQNRYKLYLDIAQILFQKHDERYKMYVENAFVAAKKFCAVGAGCNKILKLIYFSVVKWKNLDHKLAVVSDQTVFQSNRYCFIAGKQLTVYQFTDWKYYLHYGLEKRDDILLEASKKWSYTGRLIAEWIHSLRVKCKPVQILKIWREKIDQVPKSGELWCEGGRIYAELHQYENASKCFRAAIHFTPQYGDSFIEQLRILLTKGRFYEVQKLKKIMLVSEPFYGHVWSFLRESTLDSTKLSMIQMWNLACEQIKNQIYKQNIRSYKAVCKFYRLLTAYEPYNLAYLNPNTYELRVKLFASYEQLENKS